MKPITQYTKSGSINIAYQVFGSGPIDLVYIPGWVSNIDLMWECPELVHFFKELGKISRVILFDKRGTGLSDRVTELSTIEERMEDIRAVMDAVGSDKAVLFGHSEGGSVSALFAATYPNRTISLIAFGIFAKRRYSEDYPWAPTDEERQKVYDMIEHSWGGGEMNLESLAPSKAKDEQFMNWLANYFRSGASPSAAMVLTKMNTQVDIINILGSIKVPTLLMQRTNDIDVKVEEGRFIAEKIPDCTFVEFEGDDHLFWAGNTEEILDEMRAFILNTKPHQTIDAELYTIIGARVSSKTLATTELLEGLHPIVEQYRGTIVLEKSGFMIARFKGPSKAAHCSVDLVEACKRTGRVISIGIQIREAAVDEADIVSRETEGFAKSMLEISSPDQILLTQTVMNLLSGSGLSLSKYKSVFDITNGQSYLLYCITDHLEENIQPTISLSNIQPKSDSLLENVLHSIDSHLSEEWFGMETLCREVGMSERQLQRKLKAVTNKSPIQLINSVRLHRAKEKMLATDLNITEIAYQTGFSSPSYFSKCFKQEFGETPSAFLQKKG